MYLFLGYLDGAAQFAQSCGGGGTSSDLPRGRTPDEDDSGFAYRCMMQSHKMFRPAAPKRGMGGRQHEGVLKFAIKIRLIVISWNIDINSTRLLPIQDILLILYHMGWIFPYV